MWEFGTLSLSSFGTLRTTALKEAPALFFLSTTLFPSSFKPSIYGSLDMFVWGDWSPKSYLFEVKLSENSDFFI